MGGLRRFEDRLEQSISKVFARTFRSAVQPVEISAALNREVDNSAQILSRERRLVPNQFHVELSDADLDRLEGMGPRLTEELRTMLRDYAQEQSYVFAGPVEIDLESAEDLTTGRFRVRSQAMSAVSTPGGDPTDTQVRRATAVLEINGLRHPLAPPGITVGRGTDADLRLDDPGVSRRHAEIRVVDDGFGNPTISVHDLGSTNGINVNGRQVDDAVLTDGSTLRIGSTTMVIRLIGQEA